MKINLLIELSAVWAGGATAGYGFACGDIAILITGLFVFSTAMIRMAIIYKR